MTKHYDIVKLREGDGIILNNASVSIDLDTVDFKDAVNDDVTFNRAVSDSTYFWVSGGGTYYINNRYLLLVKRRDDARVNPGKYSLFTGRANSLEEILNPDLCIRELFEEIILFSGDQVYYPESIQYGDLIGKVYQDLTEKFNLDNSRFKKFTFDINLNYNRLIKLKYQNQVKEYSLNYHINSKKDFNILFLLSANLDTSNLFAIDGEYHIEPGKIIKHNRKIYLYDLLTSEAKEISTHEKAEIVNIATNDMTEHLKYLTGLIKESSA
jgi:hypothetical protein